MCLESQTNKLNIEKETRSKNVSKSLFTVTPKTPSEQLEFYINIDKHK